MRELTLSDALAVVRDMRLEDRACVAAMNPGLTDEQFAVNRWQTHGPAWVIDDDHGAPVAIGGVSFQTDWLGVFWFVATPRMRPKHWKNTIRNLDTVLARAQEKGNPYFKRRLEAYTLGGWEEAARFAASRFEFEGTKRGAGANGEDILMWARVAP